MVRYVDLLLSTCSLFAARRRTMGKIISQRSRAKLTRTRGSFPAGLESWHFPVRGFMGAQPSPRPSNSTANDATWSNMWPRASTAVGWLGPTRGVVQPAPRRRPHPQPDFAVGDAVELLWHADRQWYASMPMASLALRIQLDLLHFIKL